MKLSHGREAQVTMHVLEGSKQDIEKQLRTNLEAFFDLYPRDFRIAESKVVSC